MVYRRYHASFTCIKVNINRSSLYSVILTVKLGCSSTCNGTNLIYGLEDNSMSTS